MNLHATIRIILLVGLLAATASASSQTPAGRWRTFDDKTGQPSSEVRLRLESDGSLVGVIEKVLDPAVPPGALCIDCKDDRHDMPVVGLTFLRSMRADGDTWSGGNILDPDDGTVYRCTMHLRKGGQQLEVRGYVGISLFGRTQVWQRLD
jgi:uncharacterized protein (DUF2147 family)